MNTSPGSLLKVISDAAEEHGTIAISWGDGHSSRFHFIWLRENNYGRDGADHVLPRGALM